MLFLRPVFRVILNALFLGFPTLKHFPPYLSELRRTSCTLYLKKLSFEIEQKTDSFLKMYWIACHVAIATDALSIGRHL